VDQSGNLNGRIAGCLTGASLVLSSQGRKLPHRALQNEAPAPAEFDGVLSSSDQNPQREF
jgi:hypothetical protein